MRSLFLSLSSLLFFACGEQPEVGDITEIDFSISEESAQRPVFEMDTAWASFKDGEVGTLRIDPHPQQECDDFEGKVVNFSTGNHDCLITADVGTTCFDMGNGICRCPDSKVRQSTTSQGTECGDFEDIWLDCNGMPNC